MKLLRTYYKTLLFPSLFIVSACAVQKETVFKRGSFVDERDGHVYKTVVIGKQVWMTENLGFATKFGSMDYDKLPGNTKVYGKLYNYSALPDACPTGWHVPSDAEWNKMQSLLPDDISKMNFQYAGYFGSGKFSHIGEDGRYWTSTQKGFPVITRMLYRNDNNIRSTENGIALGLSLRCVKDTIF
ncbi:hypothetical protein KXQ82_08750 [Mucilaginibacter sp. HMF5004]|uniref:FISUMP domain-containing protein n=1 Tax=Mucilaginibacter rivuli TaxID=2857527 RepID=UPI001C5D6C0F|nr:FISUMP domain-containing protein [Mucilaginibacter rivuli]MBW4889803.1 hypothetical protein [Mucilaginibacter rivuli]